MSCRSSPAACVCSCQPFVEDTHTLQAYFPARHWAIAIPATLLVVLVSVATAFIALVTIKKARKKAKKA